MTEAHNVRGHIAVCKVIGPDRPGKMVNLIGEFRQVSRPTSARPNCTSVRRNFTDTPAQPFRIELKLPSCPVTIEDVTTIMHGTESMDRDLKLEFVTSSGSAAAPACRQQAEDAHDKTSIAVSDHVIDTCVSLVRNVRPVPLPTSASQRHFWPDWVGLSSADRQSLCKPLKFIDRWLSSNPVDPARQWQWHKQSCHLCCLLHNDFIPSGLQRREVHAASSPSLQSVALLDVL